MFECATRHIVSALTFLLVASSMATFSQAADPEQTSDAFEQRHRLIDVAQRRGASAIPILAEAVNDPHETVRYTAAHLLADFGPAANNALVQTLDHEDPQVKLIAVKTLERNGVVDRHIETLVRDDSHMVRRYFYLHLLPEYLLEDGKPSDHLIAAFGSVYADANDAIRTEIIKAVSELPITPESRALLNRAADMDKAAAAVDDSGDDDADTKALLAQVALLESDIKRMRKLADAKNWQQLVDEFKDADIAAWPDTAGGGRMLPTGWYANQAAEARYWLGRAWYELGDADKAEAQLTHALRRGPSLGHRRERNFYRGVLHLLGQNYQQNLEHPEKVGPAYAKRLADHAEALVRRGRPDEALSIYRSALKVEGISDEQKAAINQAIEQLP